MAQRILLVQDDSAVAEAIMDVLTRSSDQSDQPFQVAWVRCCADGLARLDRIEAILVDLYLPDSRGIETFDRLIRAAPKIPILVLIDQINENTARLAVQCGAQDYLFKDRLDPYLFPKTLSSMIERAAYAEASFDEHERAHITLDSISDGVVSTDISGQITYMNAVAAQLTGWPENEATGHPLQDVFKIVDATTRQSAENPMTLAMRDNRTVALAPNCVLIRRDGAEAAIEDSSAPIHDRRGALTGAVMVFHDVSVLRAMTLKMSYLAQHDSLTDLPNRVLLRDRLDEAITLSQRYHRKLAVLYVDLDRFKHINDSLGHVIGDGLLQSAARRLFTCVRSSDTVGRQGGDEFLVLLWDMRRPQDAAVTAKKIVEALREPHHIDTHRLHISASIGIATYPDDGADADTLIQRADLAMYHAKETGRDGFKFFKPEMNARAIERQSLEDGLHYAIERRELVLHYQPKLCLATGDIVGVEALIRWNHPQRGRIPPGQFIAIAEDCGLIVPIGQWVLREACRQARAWQQLGLAPLCIAINISAVELRAPGFVSSVKAVLAETGWEPFKLELEITETGLLEDSRLTADARCLSDVLRELKDIGVSLALDDFGTGYSSLSHLKCFPIDTLKIDQSFVRDLGTNEDGVGIITGLISMGKCLDMQVVAEGVETREQFENLKTHGCPQGQGYYFSPPVPAEEFGRLLERDAARTHLSDKSLSEGIPLSAAVFAV